MRKPHSDAPLSREPLLPFAEVANPEISRPLRVTEYLGPQTPEAPKEFLVALELSGNGFTFEMRERCTHHQKYAGMDRIKVKLPNSADIRETGSISEKSIEQIMRQLHHIKGVVNNQIRLGHTVYLKAIGTAALRDAMNGPEIEKAIHDLTGITFEKIDGRDEAVLCARGITLFYADISGLVLDMGGGSTELALVRNGNIEATRSLPMGTSSIATSKNPKAFIKGLLEGLPPQFRQTQDIFLSGGTFRNINNALAALEGIDIKAAELQTTSAKDYAAFIERLLDMSEEDWKEQPENLQMRREFIPAGHAMLEVFRDLMDKKMRIALTKTKTRDGMFRAMNEEIVTYEQNLPLPIIRAPSAGDGEPVTDIG